MNANNTEIWVMFGHLIFIIRREVYIDPELYRLILFLSDLKTGRVQSLIMEHFSHADTPEHNQWLGYIYKPVLSAVHT